MVEFLRLMSESLAEHHCGLSDYEYSSIADFVLREGEAHEPRPLPDRYVRRTPGYCFDNAHRLAKLSRGRLTYVEGYAFGQFIPVHHAWCVDDEGRVHDPTWAPLSFKVGKEYFGVRMPIEVVDEAHLGREHRSVIDDWTREWPLLKRPWNELKETVCV